MQPSYPFFLPFPLPIFLTFSSTQIYSHSLSCICSHHTHFFSLFPPLKYLLIMQPSYPFFSPFHPLKYLLNISHAYATIIPIFLTFSSTQISSHSLSCVCSPHACMLVPKVFNTWWFPNSLPPNHSIPSPRSYMATFGMQSHHHISSFLILHILISKLISKFSIFKFNFQNIYFQIIVQNSDFQIIFKTSIP